MLDLDGHGQWQCVVARALRQSILIVVHDGWRGSSNLGGKKGFQFHTGNKLNRFSRLLKGFAQKWPFVWREVFNGKQV